MALTKVTGEGVGDVDTLSVFKASTCEVLIGTDNAGTAQISFYESNTSTKEGLLKYDGNTNTVVLGTSGSATALAMARDTGAITVIGEGSATTSLQQGLAKAWVKFTQVGTHTAADSFNLTSLTDNGTGNSTVTIANDLANANGPISVTSDNGSNFNNGAMGRMTAAGTASVRCSATTSAAGSDKAHTQAIFFGDLA